MAAVTRIPFYARGISHSPAARSSVAPLFYQQVRKFDPVSRSLTAGGIPQVRWQPSLTTIIKCNCHSIHKGNTPSQNTSTDSTSVEPWVAIKIGALAVVPLVIGAFFKTAIASAVAEHSIGTSSLGLKVATYLRGSGWCDEAIVAFVASLPILELRGAIPVGYWMQLPPLKTYLLAAVGNMLPVPFIVLYLEKLFRYVAARSEGGKKLVDRILMSTRRKAEPIQEFQWLGLMLFVAVPFPGTGAWTGAFAASILGFTFWDAMSANFVGVLLAGVLVNLVVSVGLREALFVGIGLFALSTFMWRILRFFKAGGTAGTQG